MRKIIIWINILIVSYTLTGCKENEGLEFSGESTLYFAHEQYGQQDSIDHSFFSVPETQERDTIEIKIEAAGYPTGTDRPFLLQQTNIGDADAAVAGKHFVAFDDPEMLKELIIPANAASKTLRLIVLKDPSLKLGKVRLALKFGTNGYFKPGVEEWRHFIIKTTAKPTKPASWDSYWLYDFGEWGAEKMTFIIRSTGFSDFDGDTPDTAYRSYLLLKATQALLEYNNNPDNDPPLKEADGTIVELKYQ